MPQASDVDAEMDVLIQYANSGLEGMPVEPRSHDVYDFDWEEHLPR